MPVLSSGDVIGGYRVEGLLGEGGMAEVHRARRPGQPAVALKLVTARVFGAEVGVRFGREVGHAARLDHPGCLKVIDHGASPRGLYLVSELLAGLSLRERIGHGPLALRHALRVADELLLALEHAHARGVVHRDLKPENVMYRRRGVDRDVVLIDFGLARALGDAPLTRAGTCLGSPSYLAPERVLGAAGDARVDLYAVGVILFELLAGHVPFRGGDPAGTARLQLEAPVPALERLRRDVPREVAAVVRCALAKRPGDRFAAAATMRAALEDAGRATWELAAVEVDPAELGLAPARVAPPPMPDSRGPRTMAPAAAPRRPPPPPRRTRPLHRVGVPEREAGS
jgi:serine/threonine protein kinase